jgi:hypothetical protein
MRMDRQVNAPVPDPDTEADPGKPPPTLQSVTTPAGPWPCATDPSVETYLRCGRCEKPICPRCLIQTPVGSRCRDCAQLRKLPMFDIKPMGYVRAVGAGLGAGIGGSLLLTLLQGAVPFFGLFGLLLMGGFGYIVGEAVSAAVRRKQGNALGVIAAVSVFVGLIATRTALFMLSGAPLSLAIMAGASSIAAPLWNALGVLLAAGIAYSRAR